MPISDFRLAERLVESASMRICQTERLSAAARSVLRQAGSRGLTNKSELCFVSANTFLFAWNAKKFPWPEIDDAIAALNRSEEVIEAWRVAAYKRIKVGDRAFMVHVGAEPRGIFGSGYVHSLPYLPKEDDHVHLVDLKVDTLLNPQKENILTLDILAIGRLSKQLWTPQGSGILIDPEIVEELELVWRDFLLQDDLS